MTAHLTRGVYCPTLTPVDERGAACMDLLVEHCRWLLDEGCDGIVLFGTTGEANSFTADERRSVLEGVAAGGISSSSLIVGTGCCAVGDTAALTKHALSVGCRRVLVLPPFYYKAVSQAGVIDAYTRAIDAIDDARVRVYLYRIPQLSGVDIGAAVIEALAARYPDVLAGIKDSAGDWQTTEALCRSFGPSLDVMVGSERFLSAALEAGASGCVSATANVHPRLLRQLYRTRDAGLQLQAIAKRDAFETVPAIAALKEVTARRTGDGRWRNVRPPLIQLNKAQLDFIVTARAQDNDDGRLER